MSNYKTNKNMIAINALNKLYYENNTFNQDELIITTNSNSYIYKYKCSMCNKFNFCEEITSIQTGHVFFYCYDCFIMNQCIGCGINNSGGLCNNCRQSKLYKQKKTKNKKQKTKNKKQKTRKKNKKQEKKTKNYTTMVQFFLC